MSKNIIFFLLLSMFLTNHLHGFQKPATESLTNHLSGVQESATDTLDGLIDTFNKKLQLNKKALDTRKPRSNNNNATKAEPDDEDQNEQERDGDKEIIVTADSTAVRKIEIPVKEGGFVTARLFFIVPVTYKNSYVQRDDKIDWSSKIALQYQGKTITCDLLKLLCQSIKDMAFDIDPDKFINKHQIKFDQAFSNMMNNKQYSDQALNGLSYLICQQFRCLRKRNIGENKKLLTKVFSNSTRFINAQQTCNKMEEERSKKYSKIMRDFRTHFYSYKDRLKFFVTSFTLFETFMLLVSPKLFSQWEKHTSSSFRLTRYFEQCAYSLGLSMFSIEKIFIKTLFTQLCIHMPCSFPLVHDFTNYCSTIPLHKWDKLHKISNILCDNNQSSLAANTMNYIEIMQQYMISPAVFFALCALLPLALVDNNDDDKPFMVVVLTLVAFFFNFTPCYHL